MTRMMEMVLYYNPGKPETMKHVGMMKSVLVRMGVRIRNISPDQVLEKVGFLAGLEGYEEAGSGAEDGNGAESGADAEKQKLPVIPEQVLVLKGFSGSRIDELLLNLRKAGVPKINLKAVLTEHNSGWTFYQLYQELSEEHQAMTAGKGQ